jgi:hypothetical protein
VPTPGASSQLSACQTYQFSASLCALAWITMGGKFAMFSGDGV